MIRSFDKISRELLSGEFVNFQLGTKWPEIVGPFLAKNCSPAFVKDEKLYLYASSSTWMHHLSLLKSEILEKIEKITKMKFIDLKILMRKKSKNSLKEKVDYSYLVDRIPIKNDFKSPSNVEDRLERLMDLGKVRKKTFNF